MQTPIDFLNEVIALTPDYGIRRADCYAAYVAAGHDARTADQFAFGFLQPVAAPIHPKALSLLTALLLCDRAAIAACYAEQEAAL